MVAISLNLAARVTACAGLVALMAPLAHAQSSSPLPEAVSIDELKNLYLGCERAALAGSLDGEAVMHCSVAYEELKRRAFGGDFQSLKAWSDAQSRLAEVTG